MDCIWSVNWHRAHRHHEAPDDGSSHFLFNISECLNSGAPPSLAHHLLIARVTGPSSSNRVGIVPKEDLAIRNVFSFAFQRRREKDMGWCNRNSLRRSPRRKTRSKHQNARSWRLIGGSKKATFFRLKLGRRRRDIAQIGRSTYLGLGFRATATKVRHLGLGYVAHSQFAAALGRRKKPRRL